MNSKFNKKLSVFGVSTAALLFIAACGSGLPTSSSSSSPSTGGGGGGGGGGGSSPGTSIVRTLGGAASSQIRNLVVDSSGNSYVAGTYTRGYGRLWH